MQRPLLSIKVVVLLMMANTYAWGETQPKSVYDWSTYKYGTAEKQLTKYCNKSSYGKNGFTDNKRVLDAGDDAATVNWGSGWRMPTNEEVEPCSFLMIDQCYPMSFSRASGMTIRPVHDSLNNPTLRI